MCPWFCGIVLVIVFVLARRYGLWYFKLVHCYSNEVWKMWWKGGHSWRFEERCEMEWTPHVVKMSNDISRNFCWFILCVHICWRCDGVGVDVLSSLLTPTVTLSQDETQRVTQQYKPGRQKTSKIFLLSSVLRNKWWYIFLCLSDRKYQILSQFLKRFSIE